MGDKLSRLEQDKALFMRGRRQQLQELIQRGNPRLIAGAIAKVLEMQIITEDIALERGIDIDDEMMAEYKGRHYEEVTEETERALTHFISSVVSQEG